MQKQSKSVAAKLTESAETSLSYVEIVTLAVFLCGGATQKLDTEDVAINVAEIAPGRFSWRKYKNQINLEMVRVSLSDAKKAAYGAYLIGSGNLGWSLTPAGLAFCKKAQFKIKHLAHKEKHNSAIDQKWLRIERERLLNAVAYQKFKKGHEDSISSADAASFFRLDDYVQGSLRQQKITRIIRAFGEHKELGPAVKFLAKKLGAV